MEGVGLVPRGPGTLSKVWCAARTPGQINVRPNAVVLRTECRIVRRLQEYSEIEISNLSDPLTRCRSGLRYSGET